MRHRISLILLAVSLVIAASASEIHAAERRPNVILIMADDLGYEALGCNGGTSYKTEKLDALAARGMRFTNCYSQPVCTPSRNKIMTGRSNARNYREFSRLIPEEITFGNIMKQAGYKTAIAGKWQLAGKRRRANGEIIGTRPDRCGFDESCMWAYASDLPPNDVRHYWDNFYGKNQKRTSRFWNPAIVQNGRYRPTTIADYGPDVFTSFLLEFIERNQQQEFFVYYPMVLTHAPYEPTPESAGLRDRIKFRRDNRYFEDMIQYTGTCVQRIIDKLEELGIAENTLVLFTTDNGTGRTIISRQGERVVPGGKGLPIDAGCHVPLLAYWKGKIAPGSLCHDLVDFSDFVPSIAELGGAQLPQDREIDGRSFLPQLLGQPGDPRTSIVVHYDKDPLSRTPRFRRVRFAYDGRYKLYKDGRMFDVPRDIEEESPLNPAELDATAIAAKKELQAALDALPAWQPDNSTFGGKPDRETQRRLKTLKRLRQN